MLHRLFLFLCLVAALTGCSTTMMQNPSPLSKGEVRLAGGVAIPTVEADVRASVGVADGFDLSVGLGGFPEQFPTLQDNDKEILSNWRISGGFGYGAAWTDKVDFKLNAEIQLASSTPTSRNPTYIFGPPQTLDESTTVSITGLISSSQKRGYGGYLGVQNNIAVRDFQKIEDCYFDPCILDAKKSNEREKSGRSRDPFLSETQSVESALGLVAGGQIWFVEDAVALQVELVANYPFYQQQRLRDINIQGTIGLVGHFSLF